MLNEVFADLPHDTDEALCIIADRVDKRIQLALTEVDAARLALAIEAFTKRMNINISFVERGDGESWRSHLEYLVNVFSERLAISVAEKEVLAAIDIYEARVKEEARFGYAFLSTCEKSSIHIHIQNIRIIINESNIFIRKKRALLDRLSRLAEEVDKDGTRTDMFFAFPADRGLVSGEMAENAKPALKEFKEVLQIVYKRRAESEGVQLPPPDEFPMFPPS